MQQSTLQRAPIEVSLKLLQDVSSGYMCDIVSAITAADTENRVHFGVATSNFINIPAMIIPTTVYITVVAKLVN